MKKFYIYIVLITLTTTFVNAQNKDTKKADKLFESLAYVDAVQEYNKLIEKGKADGYVYEQLAKGYAFLNDTKKAESFYKRVAKQKNVNPETIYAYAQTLKANGKSADYKSWMKQFVNAKPSDSRAKIFMSNPNYLGELLAMEPLFTVKNAKKLNSPYADFGSFVQDNKIYFASGRNTDRKNHNLNGEPFLEIFSATIDGSALGSPEMIEGDVNTKYHEGTVAISPDGKRMFFDRNDYFEGDLDKSNEGVNQINLYTAEKVGGAWKNIQSVPFNDDNYSTGHPALSPDGKTLYFSSDKPGGKGGSDIYMVSIGKDGAFGTPEALTGNINTSGTEVFPFIGADGTLYFSSNGHLGLGGLDAFSASAKAGSFSNPENLGPGVNSGSDDFALYVAPDNKTGFISSNRQGGSGSDDIYILDQVPPCDVDIAITVEDEEGNGISKALVEVINVTENTTDSDTATTTGKYLFASKCSREYSVTASADGYKSKTRTLTVGKSGSNNTITLEAIKPVITETEVILNPIYFDFDKWDIRPDAALELDRLIDVMNTYPAMVISAESHTDIRGPQKYNQRLSQSRADAMKDYIISKGIDSSRISGAGKGESEPAIDCQSNCTEDEHQLNRRCVFKIVSR